MHFDLRGRTAVGGWHGKFPSKISFPTIRLILLRNSKPDITSIRDPALPSMHLCGPIIDIIKQVKNNTTLVLNQIFDSGLADFFLPQNTCCGFYFRTDLLYPYIYIYVAVLCLQSFDVTNPLTEWLRHQLRRSNMGKSFSVSTGA